MSFFLLQTNLIAALQNFGKEFWMPQADTLPTTSLFDQYLSISSNETGVIDILLDQQAHENVGEGRKRTMNGANFLIFTHQSARELVRDWLAWQKYVYITDPDLVKIFCLRGDYNCGYVPHREPMDTLSVSWLKKAGPSHYEVQFRRAKF